MKKFGYSLLVAATLAGLGAGEATAQSFVGGDVSEARAGFGAAMVVNGADVLVGEPANVMRSGLVYVYRQGDDGVWAEVASFGASDGATADGFGQSLATDADVLLVGSPAGVYSFVRSGDGWMEEGMIPTPAMLDEDARFGQTLAVAGDVALVGAPGVAEGTGAVYVYRRSTDGWSEAGTLETEGLAAGGGFGTAVAFDGTFAAVGAPIRNNRTGGAFLFQATATGFDMLAELPTNGLARNDRFGSAVFLNGGRLAVGALGANGSAGVVHVFESDDRGWMRGPTLAAFDPSPRAGFGSAVAVVGDDVWVGAPLAGRGAGAVYAFRIDETGVVAAEKVRGEGLDGRVQAGAALAAGDGFVAVATPGADRGAGAVVMFDGSGGAWMAAARVQSPAEGYDPVRGEEVRCAEGEAVEWDCSEVDLVSFVPVSELSGDAARGIVTNDNWGWVDPETGRSYALVGMTDRASFVDITDVTNPMVVGTLPMTEGANGSAWRDLKTYENHVYIVSDGAGQHGMQVFDLTRLREFDGGEPVVFDADALYSNIASAHNIVINEDSGFAYAVGAGQGGETCGGGLHMIDIRDPKNPQFAGCFADPQTGRASTGYSHDAHCVNYVGPDEDHAGAEICMGANETAISIADVTDKANPIAISRAAYPSVGYSHQGWLTEDHRFFYLNDELDEIQGSAARTRTMIWDVSDLDDPQLVAEHLGTQESSDHNLYIVGNLMYQSNYRSGLRILHITTPEEPVEVAYFDTVAYGDNSAGMGGSWSNYPFFDNGVVIVTSGSEGLFLVRPTVRRTVF
ncbi:MAG: choice-of-anchor B family protein [Gemmatimonadetes bacterium]|nr:choice-of-anchor B family protein [Gemmatimonadota bacterium]